MQCSPEGINEFQAIAKEDYGVELTYEEASILATQALLLYELIYQPLPSERAARQRGSSPAPAPHPGQATPDSNQRDPGTLGPA